MLGGGVGPGQVSGGSAGRWARCCWPVGCLGYGQAWSGRVRAAVSRGALWLAGWTGPQSGARAAWCGDLWWQGILSVLARAWPRKEPSGGVRRGRPRPGFRRVMLCDGRCSGMLRVRVVSMLPVSVRRGLRGGERVSTVAGGLGVTSHRRLLSLRVAWRVSGRRLRTYVSPWVRGVRGG